MEELTLQLTLHLTLHLAVELRRRLLRGAAEAGRGQIWHGRMEEGEHRARRSLETHLCRRVPLIGEAVVSAHTMALWAMVTH